MTNINLDCEVFPITVGSNQSVEALMRVGAFGFKHKDITDEHFPMKESCAVECKALLFGTNRGVTSENIRTRTVLDYFNMRCVRPATLPELLTFGMQYGQVEMDCSIVEFGSVWFDTENTGHVASLYCPRRNERHVHLLGFENVWSWSYRFLAVSA